MSREFRPGKLSTCISSWSQGPLSSPWLGSAISAWHPSSLWTLSHTGTISSSSFTGRRSSSVSVFTPFGEDDGRFSCTSWAEGLCNSIEWFESISLSRVRFLSDLSKLLTLGLKSLVDSLWTTELARILCRKSWRICASALVVTISFAFCLCISFFSLECVCAVVCLVGSRRCLGLQTSSDRVGWLADWSLRLGPKQRLSAPAPEERKLN